jgi:hypothetical protein
MERIYLLQTGMTLIFYDIADLGLNETLFQYQFAMANPAVFILQLV